MSQHEINPDSERYHPSKLERKEYIGIGEFLSLDMRIGTIVKVHQFPEMRKPSYKIKVDFGEKIGRLWTSAQITNYSRGEVKEKLLPGSVIS